MESFSKLEEQICPSQHSLNYFSPADTLSLKIWTSLFKSHLRMDLSWKEEKHDKDVVCTCRKMI